MMVQKEITKMTQVTKNSTKDQIYAALQDTIKQLQAAQANKVDPAGEVAAKKTAQTLEKASTTVDGSVADKIAALQKNIVTVLGGLSGQLTEEIDTFNNLQEAIKLKEAELKEVFGIETEAFALAALINTQNEQREKFAVEMDEKRAVLRADLDELNKAIQQKRIDIQNETAELKAAAQKERQRDKEQYDYDFNRDKTIAKNALADELAAERKAFDEQIEAERKRLQEEKEELVEREEEVAAREEKIDELEAKVAAIPEREAKIREEVEAQTRKDEQRVAAIKDSYAKKDAENAKAILDNKVEMLEKALVAEQLKNAELSTKLDTAYEKIQNMALASVSGAQESKAFDKVANLLSEKQGK